MILPRSGLGHKHGIVLGNLVGLIDLRLPGADLRLHLEPRPRALHDPALERIAQLVVVPVLQVGSTWSTFDESERGAAGFGSTGKH